MEDRDKFRPFYKSNEEFITMMHQLEEHFFKPMRAELKEMKKEMKTLYSQLKIHSEELLRIRAGIAGPSGYTRLNIEEDLIKLVDTSSDEAASKETAKRSGGIGSSRIPVPLQGGSRDGGNRDGGNRDREKRDGRKWNGGNRDGENQGVRVQDNSLINSEVPIWDIQKYRPIEEDGIDYNIPTIDFDSEESTDENAYLGPIDFFASDSDNCKLNLDNNSSEREHLIHHSSDNHELQSKFCTTDSNLKQTYNYFDESNTSNLRENGFINNEVFQESMRIFKSQQETFHENPFAQANQQEVAKKSVVEEANIEKPSSGSQEFIFYGSISQNFQQSSEKAEEGNSTLGNRESVSTGAIKKTKYYRRQESSANQTDSKTSEGYIYFKACEAEDKSRSEIKMGTSSLNQNNYSSSNYFDTLKSNFDWKEAIVRASEALKNIDSKFNKDMPTEMWNETGEVEGGSSVGAFRRWKSSAALNKIGMEDLLSNSDEIKNDFKWNHESDSTEEELQYNPLVSQEFPGTQKNPITPAFIKKHFYTLLTHEKSEQNYECDELQFPMDDDFSEEARTLDVKYYSCNQPQYAQREFIESEGENILQREHKEIMYFSTDTEENAIRPPPPKPENRNKITFDELKDSFNEVSNNPVDNRFPPLLTEGLHQISDISLLNVYLNRNYVPGKGRAGFLKRKKLRTRRQLNALKHYCADDGSHSTEYPTDYEQEYFRRFLIRKYNENVRKMSDIDSSPE